jgi:prephenate dehydrogenase
MAGKTDVGPAAADAALFEGARWVIVPAVHSATHAIESVQNVVAMMGATPMLMDAEEHDSYAAAISHMPMLAAMALFSMERASEAWPELSMLAAGGFKDMTRLSSTDAGMAHDIVVTNRDNTVHWLNRYVGALLEIRDRLADEEGEEDFFKLLAATEFEYSTYQLGKVGREESRPALDSAEFSFQDFIAGTWVRERINQVAKDADDRLRERETEARRRRDI